MLDSNIPSAPRRDPWNKGRLIGQKRPLKPKDVWSIRIRLQVEHRARNLALFNLANDELSPVATEVEGELILPTGEVSIMMVAEMADRIDADGRPAVVIYFADFDPSGWQMPISVSRKLQALKTQRYPDIEVEVHRAAVTLQQAEDYDLPSTPLKETEKRGTRWKQAIRTKRGRYCWVRDDLASRGGASLASASNKSRSSQAGVYEKISNAPRSPENLFGATVHSTELHAAPFPQIARRV